MLRHSTESSLNYLKNNRAGEGSSVDKKVDKKVDKNENRLIKKLIKKLIKMR